MAASPRPGSGTPIKTRLSGYKEFYAGNQGFGDSLGIASIAVVNCCILAFFLFEYACSY